MPKQQQQQAPPDGGITDGFVTEKEAHQADVIARQGQLISDLQRATDKLMKATGVTPEAKKFTTRLGFLRSLDGKDPIVKWETDPKSFVRLDSFGNIMDEWYITIFTLSGHEERMHYRDFDVRTSNHPIAVEIHGVKTNIEGKVISFPDPDRTENPGMKDAGDYEVNVTVKTTNGDHPLEGTELRIKVRFIN
jgi:hypothetical protein